MRCFPPTDDTGAADAPLAEPTQAQPPERPDEEDGRLVEAELASLESLAHALAMAARGAHRVTEWEGLIFAELHAPSGRRRATI